MSWLTYTYGYKTSGHVFCAMVSYTNWWNLIWTLEEYKPSIWDTPLVGIKYLAIALTAYQLFGLYFTCYIYHHYSECLYGFLNGVVVCHIVFHNDIFSTCLYRLYILTLSKIGLVK